MYVCMYVLRILKYVNSSMKVRTYVCICMYVVKPILRDHPRKDQNMVS